MLRPLEQLFQWVALLSQHFHWHLGWWHQPAPFQTLLAVNDLGHFRSLLPLQQEDRLPSSALYPVISVCLLLLLLLFHLPSPQSGHLLQAEKVHQLAWHLPSCLPSPHFGHYHQQDLHRHLLLLLHCHHQC